MKFRSTPVRLSDPLATAADPNSIPADVQIMRVGSFYSDEHGNLKITTAMLQNMVKNFSERVRGVDLAIDYKHDSDNIAAGWIKQLYLLNDNNELWAKVDWTPKGTKVLSDKEFRYLSADFHLDFKHNETNKTHGPTLFGAGLTNRPFIKEMDPVVELSEKQGDVKMDDKDKQIADLQAQVAALKKQIEDDGKSEGDNDKPALDDQPQMADVQKECAALKEKVAAYEAAAAKSADDKKLSEKKATFDKLLSEGKAVEAQRTHFMSGDTIKFAENAGKPNLEGNGSSNDAPAPEPKDKDAAIEEVGKLAHKLSDEKKISIGEAQSIVLHSNPELRKKIYG